MNILSRSTDYAVRALVYMAGKAPEKVSSADLDRNLRLPRPFMRRILQTLQKAGYLISTKGRNGGFLLAMPTNKICLVDLVTVFQGAVTMGDCLFRKKVCAHVGDCPLRREIKLIESMVLAHLRGVTVASLIQGGARPSSLEG